MDYKELDRIDKIILSDLINDARKPYLEIARECGVSGAAIHQRVKKLESLGVISGSSSLISPASLGYTICAFIFLNLTESNKYQEVIHSLEKVPEIVECHFITGRSSILVKVYCHDNAHLMNIVINTIQKIPFVQSSETMISLEETIKRQIYIDKDSL
ncbi:MAG: Lrp/AsnC family transcriptional regulator [Candidatus Cryptobacteroides sp.]